MNEERERAAIVELLAPHGLGELAGHLSLVRVREHSRTWSTTVLSPAGDVEVRVVVYPVADDPAAAVDFEEARTGLVGLAESGQAQPGEQRIFAAARSDDLAVLVLVAAEDEAIAQRVIRPRATSGTLHYHPQLDRILGGDFAHEFQGQLMRASLMSLHRADRLQGAVQSLAEAYRRQGSLALGDPLPFSQPAVIVALDSVSREDLVGAPAEYGRLALVHSVAPAGEALGAEPSPVADVVGLATRLAGTVGCGHQQASVVFSRARGCCLRPEFVTAAGDLIDLYFLTATADLASTEAHDARIVDLVNLFDTLALTAASNPECARAMSAALAAYATQRSPAPELIELAYEIAADRVRFAVLARAALADPANRPATPSA